MRRLDGARRVRLKVSDGTAADRDRSLPFMPASYSNRPSVARAPLFRQAHCAPPAATEGPVAARDWPPDGRSRTQTRLADGEFIS